MFQTTPRAEVDRGAIETALAQCMALEGPGMQVFCAVTPGRLAFGLVGGLGRGTTFRQRNRPRPIVTLTLGRSNCVTLQSQGGPRCVVRFSVADAVRSQVSDTRRIASAIGSGVCGFGEQVRSGFVEFLHQVVGKSTGCMLAVADGMGVVEAVCRDAVLFQVPLDLPAMFAGDCDDGSNPTDLHELEPLVQSIVDSDGITVFDRKGRIAACRWFVAFPSNSGNIVGGARQRAFETLRGMVAEGALYAAFLRSQTGGTSIVESADVAAELRRN